MARPNPSGSIVYTHGTGTRKSGFDRDWNTFRHEARRRGFGDIRLIPCAWGPSLREGVPDEDLVKSVVPGGRRSDDALKWELLVRDPLFELRLAAITLPPGATSAGGSLAGALGSVERIATAWPELGLELAVACRKVAASPELRDAERAAGNARKHVARAAARASVAFALASMEGRFGGRPDRDMAQPALNAVANISEALGAMGDESPPWAESFQRFARANEWPSRSCLTQAATEFFADVMWYLRSSQPIAEELRAAILDAQSTPPVVVVAHSLGGIAAVDLLSDVHGTSELAVDLLVTFGTQAGLLYAMDALRYLRLADGQPTSRVVRQWLSFYGEGDLLSFKVTPLAGLADETKDKKLNFSEWFPGLHGEYIRLDAFWDTIRGNWPTGSGT